MDFDHYLIIFDFDLGGGTVIRGRPLLTSLSQMRRLFE